MQVNAGEDDFRVKKAIEEGEFRKHTHEVTFFQLQVSVPMKYIVMERVDHATVLQIGVGSPKDKGVNPERKFSGRKEASPSMASQSHHNFSIHTQYSLS